MEVKLAQPADERAKTPALAAERSRGSARSVIRPRMIFLLSLSLADPDSRRSIGPESWLSGTM
jgi:hypothetical protein